MTTELGKKVVKRRRKSRRGKKKKTKTRVSQRGGQRIAVRQRKGNVNNNQISIRFPKSQHHRGGGVIHQGVPQVQVVENRRPPDYIHNHNNHRQQEQALTAQLIREQAEMTRTQLRREERRNQQLARALDTRLRRLEGQRSNSVNQSNPAVLQRSRALRQRKAEQRIQAQQQPSVLDRSRALRQRKAEERIQAERQPVSNIDENLPVLQPILRPTRSAERRFKSAVSGAVSKLNLTGRFIKSGNVIGGGEARTLRDAGRTHPEPQVNSQVVDMPQTQNIGHYGATKWSNPATSVSSPRTITGQAD